MSEPFIGEIRIFGFPNPPKYWMACNGQLLSIAQNTALFSILGTNYGGNGQTNFGLPDFRGRVALSAGQGPGLPFYNLGEIGGEMYHTLIQSEMPAHMHLLQGNHTQAASSNATAGSPTAVLGKSQQKPPQGGVAQPFYPYSTTTTGLTPLNASALAVVGGTQPHENRQPYLGLNICIAVQGIFPSRN